MKLVDLNVLLYAVDEASAHHVSARECLEGLLNGDESVALPWVVLTGFVRLVTHRRVCPVPLDVATACDLVEQWLACAPVVVIREKPSHWRTLRTLLTASGTAANLTTDAHIAALAITHDATVVSFDRDFQRFDGLKLIGLSS